MKDPSIPFTHSSSNCAVLHVLPAVFTRARVLVFYLFRVIARDSAFVVNHVQRLLRSLHELLDLLHHVCLIHPHLHCKSGQARVLRTRTQQKKKAPYLSLRALTFRYTSRVLKKHNVFSSSNLKKQTSI